MKATSALLFSVWLWASGGDDTSQPKMDGTDQVFPPLPVAGDILVDNIWFEVPEPMTIGLLGLGGLLDLADLAHLHNQRHYTRHRYWYLHQHHLHHCHLNPNN